MDWYILQSLSGQEKRIATLIKEKARKDGLDEYIEEDSCSNRKSN